MVTHQRTGHCPQEYASHIPRSVACEIAPDRRIAIGSFKEEPRHDDRQLGDCCDQTKDIPWLALHARQPERSGNKKGDDGEGRSDARDPSRPPSVAQQPPEARHTESQAVCQERRAQPRRFFEMRTSERKVNDAGEYPEPAEDDPRFDATAFTKDSSLFEDVRVNLIDGSGG